MFLDLISYIMKFLSPTLFHRVELFDGAGGLAEGFIYKVDKGGSDVALLEDARVIPPQGIQWHVFAAFGESCETNVLCKPGELFLLHPVINLLF
jgi:hypothetical protein